MGAEARATEVVGATVEAAGGAETAGAGCVEESEVAVAAVAATVWRRWRR